MSAPRGALPLGTERGAEAGGVRTPSRAAGRVRGVPPALIHGGLLYDGTVAQGPVMYLVNILKRRTHDRQVYRRIIAGNQVKLK